MTGLVTAGNRKGDRGAPLPDWYHEDNLFPSRERMDWAHRPIVEAALEAVAGHGGNVLDLGCGNAALLKKIHQADRKIIPFGIDRVAERVEHARQLLPGFSENFIAGDIFEPERTWPSHLHFALVILSPRRLQEAGSAKSSRLKRWIRERADGLLVYGYGKALTEFGSLAGMAQTVGVTLQSAEPGVRASVAARF